MDDVQKLKGELESKYEKLRAVNPEDIKKIASAIGLKFDERGKADLSDPETKKKFDPFFEEYQLRKREMVEGNSPQSSTEEKASVSSLSTDELAQLNEILKSK